MVEKDEMLSRKAERHDVRTLHWSRDGVIVSPLAAVDNICVWCLRNVPVER